jgi:hypothetical protein
VLKAVSRSMAPTPVAVRDLSSAISMDTFEHQAFRRPKVRLRAWPSGLCLPHTISRCPRP